MKKGTGSIPCISKERFLSGKSVAEVLVTIFKHTHSWVCTGRKSILEFSNFPSEFCSSGSLP